MLLDPEWPKATGCVKGKAGCTTRIVYRQRFRIGNGKFLFGDGDWRVTQRWRCYWRFVTKN